MCNLEHNSNEFMKYFRALHCPTRWEIIRFIGEGEKTTGEIFEALEGPKGHVSRPNLYYHLSELEEAGIIELAAYKETGGGAPEKVWRLKAKEIKINLLKEDQRR